MNRTTCLCCGAKFAIFASIVYAQKFRSIIFFSACAFSFLVTLLSMAVSECVGSIYVFSVDDDDGVDGVL